MQISERQTDTWQGLRYNKEASEFRIFAEGSKNIKLAIYDDYDQVFRNEYEMIEQEDGFFYYKYQGDLEGKYYTYLVGDYEVTDPNSYACSINSQKSAIIDLEKTNPEGFKNHKIPNNPWEKSILYEVHMADFTGHISSGVKNRAKFLGMAEAGTKFEDIETGLDHLESLGVTHIHLLPVYDFISVNEKKSILEDDTNYNWGYDPELYNCLEGSYSTNPYDPANRIYEFKYLVQEIHKRGMSVVVDVVYNHTYKTDDSNFNLLAPNYYHRNSKGKFQDASGCGNEFASEKEIASEFIINSLLFWVNEYKIDGFRFDLMAIIDIDTIMTAIEKLREINPNIIIYGEPWMAFTSLLDLDKQVIIGAQKDKNFAIFNPFFRDALRGDNDGTILGYLQGDYSLKNDVELGIAGSIYLDGRLSNFNNPIESINYFNAHDNLIFQDKLIKSNVPEELHEKMTVMAFSILIMSQGIPFFHAGNEFLRSKNLDHNSYRSPLSVNAIDWSLKKKHYDVYQKVSELIKFRKDLGIFNLTTQEEVLEKMTFFDDLSDYIIAFLIRWEGWTYLIVHNLSNESWSLTSYDLGQINMIWSNGFVDNNVNSVEVEGFTTNVYKIKGEINEL